ncbi:unnamed protein product [Caenorhabditis auriculariae]|uniref:Serpentine receptor class gamma n=1 Tax=Caenorhabditis auriculariae TaxID=2777116 RepID=A0A8S1HV38_9PELO|nr:unnamed protein product [Caenorhabditis auriculariae]
MALTWQTCILSVFAVATLPLYFRILYILIRYRKRQVFRTHFYAITVYQGVIDVVGFFVYYCSFNLRGIEALRPLYLATNGTPLVNFLYVQTYFFQYARITGVVLISVQRCITVAFARTSADYLLRKFPSWAFLLVQCLLPLALYGNMMLVPMHLDENLNHIIEEQTLLFHYWKSAVIPAVAMTACIVSYVVIGKVLRVNGVRSKRELQLTVQVSGLQLALLIISIHFILQLIFVYSKMLNAVFMMRNLLPLWVGFLTFINPWMMMLVNRDVRKLCLNGVSETNRMPVSEIPTVSTRGKSRQSTVFAHRFQ